MGHHKLEFEDETVHSDQNPCSIDILSNCTPMLSVVLAIITAGSRRISISHIAKKSLNFYRNYLIFLFNSVMNFFIFGFGIIHPHALSCPPPEPPRSVAKILTIFPK